MISLKGEEKQETIIELLISEALKTSEIEGEYMSRLDVMSSIKRNLGFKDIAKVSDKRAVGIADLMTSVRDSFNVDLSKELILHWHKILMHSFRNINAGEWRKEEETKQVVSGSYGKEIVHYLKYQ